MRIKDSIVHLHTRKKTGEGSPLSEKEKSTRELLLFRYINSVEN